jgi:hypothetical protein
MGRRQIGASAASVARAAAVARARGGGEAAAAAMQEAENALMADELRLRSVWHRLVLLRLRGQRDKELMRVRASGERALTLNARCVEERALCEQAAVALRAAQRGLHALAQQERRARVEMAALGGVRASMLRQRLLEARGLGDERRATSGAASGGQQGGARGAEAEASRQAAEAEARAARIASCRPRAAEPTGREDELARLRAELLRVRARKAALLEEARGDVERGGDDGGRAMPRATQRPE